MKVKKLEGAAAIRQTLQGKKHKAIHVLKLRSIPYGFFEKELFKYFKQFGNVLRVRVARSKKTGNHKGWAYVAFDDSDVAQIAAESMNGYLMFDKRVKAHVMKPEEIPEHMKKGPRLKEPPHRFGSAIKETKLQWKERTDDREAKLKKQRGKNLTKRLNKLKAMGIDYDLATNSNEQTQDLPQVVEQETSADSEVASKKKRSLDKQAQKSLDETILVEDDEKRISDAVAQVEDVANADKLTSIKKSPKPTAGTPIGSKKTPIVEATQHKTPVLLTPKAKTPKSTTPIAGRVRQRLTPARIAHQQKQETAGKEAATPKATKGKTPSRQGKQQ
ncbi:unnamed protein product, partial [Mesorhabditis belari]|uniref:RRM domain-containing protein n=1 Tax=Mesorhabditis belari TaxID=2138241 RepID=A0AAF3EWU9_9BILA